MREGRPAWFFLSGSPSAWSVVFADDGAVSRQMSGPEAILEASRFALESGWKQAGWRGAAHDGLIEKDQWTVYSGNNAFRPFHRIRLEDDQARVLYISAVTGEVIRDTTRMERGWNWAGAVLHWLYWTPLRQNAATWRTVVISASLLGCVAVATGFVVGLFRVRRSTHLERFIEIHQGKGSMRLHLWMGAGFGWVTGTWILSGFLSMNAWNLFHEGTISQAERELYQAGPLRLGPWRPVAGSVTTKDYELVQVNGRSLWISLGVGVGGMPRTEVFDLETGGDLASRGAKVRFEQREILEGAARLMRGLNPERISLLKAGDAYHYQRHETATLFRPEVIRLEYTDSHRTTIYVDSVTGGLIRRHTRVSRLYRWLYHGLHSFDFAPLWPRRPLWDTVMLSLLSGGLGLSLTGVVLGVKRIRKSF